MGRSSAEQASRNRARIVAQASRLFRERGVENVSVSDVMAAAGMTVGGFYKHFASKEALVQEACALSFKQAARSWRAVGNRSGGADARIAALVRHYFKARSADQTCPMLAYAPGMSVDGISAPTRQVYSDGAEVLFEQFMEAADVQSDPASREEDAVTFAAMIGAQLLVQVTHGSLWSQSLAAAVAHRAAKTHGDRIGRIPTARERSPAAMPSPHAELTRATAQGTEIRSERIDEKSRFGLAK